MTTVQQPAENLAWYALSAQAAAGQMGVDPDAGLTISEVERRQAEYGPNELPTEPPPSMWAVARGQLVNPMNIMLLIAAAVTLVLALGFNLDAIASIGSAVALVIFTMITAAHVRIREQTGAKLPILILAIVAAGAVFVTFVFTTLIHEPASIVTIVVILVLSVALDYGWKHFRDTRAKDVQLAH